MTMIVPDPQKKLCVVDHTRWVNGEEQGSTARAPAVSARARGRNRFIACLSILLVSMMMMIERVAINSNIRNEFLRVTLDLLNVPCGGGVWGILYRMI